MPTIFHSGRYFAPQFGSWDEADARMAIAETTSDAIAHGDPVTLWPSHPMDEGLVNGNGSVYFGAAGVIWALDYLRRALAIKEDPDLGSMIGSALERNAPRFAGTVHAPPRLAAHGRAGHPSGPDSHYA